MTVAIEKASRAEIDAVVGMVRSFYEESSYPFEVAAGYAAIDALIADPKKGGLWIVKADGEAVGTVSVHFISRSSEPMPLPSACIEAGVLRCTAAL